MKYRITLSIVLLLFIQTLVSAENKTKLLTIPEKTDYTVTSKYDDVLSFVKQIKKIAPSKVRVESLAITTEGRSLPLVFIGSPLPKTPKDLKSDKRARVYIQANIHAGEVEGKEAALMLMRDILNKETAPYLKNVLLIVCPIFNADGNEKIAKENRSHQNGPVGVGVRHNGQNLDLNRDAMKVETPEVAGLINAVKKWDPHLFVDLHTTNGSYHQEPTTYTWMMNGNTNKSLIDFMRDKMMPFVNTTMTNKYNTLNCFYGEFKDMRNPEKGWEAYASEPRYIVNYFGLRNRLAILNENYVYADFKSRIWGCYYMLRGILDYANDNSEAIIKLIKDADEATIQRGMNITQKDSFAVEFTNIPLPNPITINTFEMEPYKDQNGRDRVRPTDKVKTVTVPYFANFIPKRNVKYPFAYLITAPDPNVINLLKQHGIKIEKLKEAATLDVQIIKTREMKPAPRLNQGHYNNITKVEYVNEKKEFAAGTIIVRTAQPLANLAAYLLEPETDDGLLYWNYWDKYLVPQWGGAFLPYPVSKLLSAQPFNSEVIKP